MRYTGLPRQRTRIVCTIGPATNTAAMIGQLIKAGMDVARLNLSHGSLDQHASCVEMVRKLSAALSRPVAVLMDIPGPKYRTGYMRQKSISLVKGAEITLTTRQIEGDDNVVPVNIATLPKDARVGSRILVDDGAIQLKVIAVDKTEVKCRVIVGGQLTAGRGVVLPGVRTSAPFVTDRLKQMVDFAADQAPDYIAVSFVNCPEDVVQIREILSRRKVKIPLIAKIEKELAVKKFDSILAVSDAVMVARGDLGVDIPLEKVPLVQKDIIGKCNRAGKPVITATQMLESMISAARPTRAEVTDVANAIFDGTDAIMLSAETSVGKYPVQAVRMMGQIARETEKKLPYEDMLIKRSAWIVPQTDELLAYDACHNADKLGAAAIVAFTESGSTAQRVSKYRPRTPIIAITSNRSVRGKLQLFWGVQAFQVDTSSSVNDLFGTASRLVKEMKLARSGQLIVITGGIPLGVAGTTNLLKVERVP
ncbi:MAG: pyruvate kinase [Dehalococcoidales bacterium]